MKKFKDNIDDFFKWVKGSELVELDDIDVSEDPVRPELTLGFRIIHGRKIFGLKYNEEIEAIVCIALCPEVPHTVREMDYMSQAANQDGKRGEIVVAYTVWSRKRGAGKQTIFITKKLVKDEMKNINRFITLSPLTPIATHFHIKHGAKLININATSQNFEYDFN